MSVRWKLTELTPTGYGRRYAAFSRADAVSLAEGLGGAWRVQRQANWGGRWHRDGQWALPFVVGDPPFIPADVRRSQEGAQP